MSIRMRHTRGHTNNRRAHHALKEMNILKEESGDLRLPHRINETTGMYRGKQIFSPKVKAERGEKTVKGPDTEPTPAHTHEHAHEAHANAETKVQQKGFLGKFMKGGRPKARSGFGGGV